MAPSLINFWILFVLSCTYSNCKTLIIQGSTSQQQFPMKRSSCMVETSRVNQHSCTFFCHYHSQLWESNIIAYSQTHCTVFGIKDTYRFSSTKCFRLVVAYFSWNIDVKKMSFIILRMKLSLRIDNKRSIEKFLVGFTWDSSDGVHFMLGTNLLDSVKSGRV